MYFFKLVRWPNLILIVLSSVVSGFFLKGAAIVFYQYYIWVLLLLMSVFAAAAGYVVNDIYDCAIDKFNAPERPLAKGLISLHQAWIYYTVLSGFSFLFSVLAGNLYWLFACAAQALLWLYAFRLKCTPLAGNLIVALLSALPLWLSGNATGRDSAQLWGLAGFAFLLSLIRELIKDVEDMAGDASVGCTTLPVIAGTGAVRYIVIVLLTLLAGAVLEGSRIYGVHTVRWLFVLGFCLCCAFIVRGVITAREKVQWSRLSQISKWTMLAGVLGILIMRLLA